MTHGRDHLLAQAFGIVAKVAYERVAENEDLIWHTAPAEEGRSRQLPADIHPVRVVLRTVIGDDDGDALQCSLKLDRQLVERVTNDLLKLRLAVASLLTQWPVTRDSRSRASDRHSV